LLLNAGDNVGTFLKGTAPFKFVKAKKRLKFGAISDNVWL